METIAKDLVFFVKKNKLNIKFKERKLNYFFFVEGNCFMPRPRIIHNRFLTCVQNKIYSPIMESQNPSNLPNIIIILAIRKFKPVHISDVFFFNVVKTNMPRIAFTNYLYLIFKRIDRLILKIHVCGLP